MIPNHDRFIEAIHESLWVTLKFYSEADQGIVERAVVPLSYGPGSGPFDGVNRYWFSDELKDLPEWTGLTSAQIVELRVLGRHFDSGPFRAGYPAWAFPEHWGDVQGTDPSLANVLPKTTVGG
jgi:hypothetical protein